MIYSAWVEIRDDFAFPAEDPEDDTELQAKNRETLSRATDIDVVPFIFKGRTQGPRTWRVYSLLYEFDTQQELEQALERFKSENPGQTDTLGAWEWVDSIACRQVGTELVIDTRIVTKTWSVLNPDYDPNEFLEDGVTPNPDYDPNYVIRVTGDVEEEYVSGITGTPLYPIPGRAMDYMPDVGDPPVAATELTSVNLLMGQPPLDFS
jgi:hypothetical protein